MGNLNLEAIENSDKHRLSARKYAEECFDYKIVVPEYIKIAQEFSLVG